MVEGPAPRGTIRESRVQLSQFMQPEHANAAGRVHGGAIARLVDEAGAVAAMRHARRPVVTVVLDSMTFLKPVQLGDFVVLTAEVVYAGRTSMEVRVIVEAEDLLKGTRTFTHTAYAVYVALDDAGRPCPVPPLVAETDEERECMERAKARQARRLQQRDREEEPCG